jgi:hypothetical protein
VSPGGSLALPAHSAPLLQLSRDLDLHGPWGGGSPWSGLATLPAVMP